MNCKELFDTAGQALRLAGADWQLQTSNSFRRIGTSRGDGNVLCATKHASDGQPDLIAAQGVLDYIVAAQPSVVCALLVEIEHLREVVDVLAKHEQRYQTAPSLKNALTSYRAKREACGDEEIL